MIEYYISSTKYSLQERQTKLNGRVYDVVFRVVTLDAIHLQQNEKSFGCGKEILERWFPFSSPLLIFNDKARHMPLDVTMNGSAPPFTIH